MSIYSSKRKLRKHSRMQPGHLKLSAYEESSALIVNIFEARGLMRKDTSVLDVYIKLYLLPDPQKNSKRKTKIIRDQDPVFNHKFTFILSAEDADKQLFISAWTPHFPSRNVMIGCMSIPMAELIGPDKGLNGWFQLLGEDRGLTEYQPVPVSISHSTHPSVPLRPGTCEIAVTVSRGEKGYGFDVRGHNPVYVSSVEPGEAAEQADVQVGDSVAVVDETDVQRANAELVQNLIAKGGERLQLILLRETTTSSKGQPHSPLSSLTSSTSSPIRGTSTLPRSHRYKSTPTHTLTQPPSSHLSPSHSYAALSQDRLHVPLHSSLSAARTSHHYSSLSHLPRTRRVSGPPIYSSSEVLSQPVDFPTFQYDPQDQFVHDATRMRHSTRSYTPQRPSLSPMHSVCEEGEVNRHDLSPPKQNMPRELDRWGRERERGRERSLPRRRHISGEGPAQLLFPSHPPHSAIFSFSQPGDPETKTIRSMSQMDSNHSGHAHYHQYHNRKRHFSGNVGRGREVEKDVLTGEARQYTGPPSVSSFSPNHPSHHHSGHNHYGNVELIGHQPLVASRSYGYSTLSQYETGTTTQGQVPCSRIGMGPTDSSSSEMEEGRIEWETLPPTEHKRQKVLQSLMETESTFHSVLQNGIETYLEPLRSVLSGSIHSKLFYNLKELCDVATRVESQLKKRRLPYVGGATKETTPYFITHIADIYHSELPELMTLLKGYLDNLHSAKQELSLAFTNEAFTHLVQKCVLEGKNKSIYAFIEAGKDYVSRLFKALLGAYYYTSSTDVDQTYLSTALRQLARICPDKDTVTKWEEEQRVMQRLEVCVSFGPKIPRIPIVVPGRVLVKEGEALLIENKGKTKVWVILFSDIVLLTQRHRGTVLMCLEPAIPLASLRVDDFNCTEDTEFQISNTEGSLIRLLRFPTISDKSDWMASLKERATGSFKRQHGERQSRVNNLPKLQNPADLLPPPPPPPHPPGPVEGDGRNKRSHSPEGAGRVATGGRPLSQWCDPSSTTKSHEFGTAGRGVKRLSQQFEHPDLGLSAANPPGWKRSTARRSFNL